MKIFYIAQNIVIRNIRDRKTLLISLLLPIVLIIILGSALKDEYTTSDFGKTSVLYVNKDRGSMAESFDKFLKYDEIKKIIDVKKSSSYEDAVKSVNNGDAEAVIFIDKNYSKEITDGNKGKIQIYADKNAAVKLQIVKSLIDSYNDGANTVMVTSQIASSNTQYTESDNIKENYLSVDGKIPRALDYYAVTMLVLTLMYSANYGCGELENMFFKNIGSRIKTTATKGYEQIFGIILGTIFTLLLQAAVLVLFTKFVYGANWGSNPIMIIMTIVALSIFAIALGVMLTALIGEADKASSILGVIVPIFTFVSGGYYKMNIDNAVFEKIKYFIPNNLAHTALFNSIYNGSLSDARQCILIILAFAAAAFIVAVISGRRKLA